VHEERIHEIKKSRRRTSKRDANVKRRKGGKNVRWRVRRRKSENPDRGKNQAGTDGSGEHKKQRKKDKSVSAGPKNKS